MTEDLTRGDTEDAGAELANSEPGAASQGVTGAEGAEQLIGQASVVVGRPAAGDIVEISAEPGETYVLDFDPSQARALVEGDNLILVFEDGAQIVFENLVNLAQLENGPSLQYAGEDMIALLQAQGIIPGVLEGIELLQPEPGQIIEIQAALGLRFIINFDPAIAVVTVDGDNLVMTFPNGGQIVIAGLGGLADDPNAPVFNIAGADIPAATLLQTTIALAAGEAGPDATATLETAAGGEGPVGTGATQYSDDTGNVIDTLAAQDVIPPVEGGSRLIDLEVVDPEFIVEVPPPATEPESFIHDESPGVQNAGGEDDIASLSTSAQAAVDAITGSTPIGQAMGMVSVSGASSVSLDSVSGTNSGLESGGSEVFLFDEGNNTITGLAGGEQLVFIVYLDDTTGEIWFVQYEPIDHDNPSDPDEAGDEVGTGFADETLTLSYTAVNGSAVTNTITIEIQDDGPLLTVTGDPTFGALSVVEASGAGNSDTVTITPPAFTASAVDGFTSDVSYVLALSGSTATGLLTTVGNFAITLDVVDANTINGIYDGANVAFTISLSGDQVTLTSFVALEHANAPQNTEDDTLDLGTLINVVATVTVTDGDNDQVVNSTDAVAPLSLTISDTDPTVLATTDLIFANSSLSGTGVFDYDIGADGNSYADASNSDFTTISLTGNVGGVPITVTVDPLWVSEDETQATFTFEFEYQPNPLQPATETVTGTLVFDKDAGTYTVTLSAEIESFTVLQTSNTLNKFSFNLVGQAASQPEVVVSQLADNGDGTGFFVQFYGAEEVGGNPGVDLHTVISGDTVFDVGDLFEAEQAWVSISGAANGVASDTLQDGEVLDMDFYTTNPGSTVTGTGNAMASGIFLKLDQLGGTEDIVVVLKLFSSTLGTTTRVIVVDSEDIWADDEVNPYGITFTDGSDGVVIIESNDYNFGAEDYLITGAQLLVSSEGVTTAAGGAIDLNRLTDDGSGTGASTFDDELDAATDDNDVIKVVDIGIITADTSTEDADLQFQFEVIDGDSDETATQTLDVHIESNAEFIGADGVAESIQGSSGDNTMTGGTGTDIFVFNLGLNEGTDTVTDFSSSEDFLSFLDVVDGIGDDIADIDAVSSISDVGGHVAVTFDSGTIVEFTSVTFSTQTSIADLVDDVSQILVTHV